MQFPFIQKIFRQLGVVDVGLLVVFVLYIVFPVSTPIWLVPYIDSSMGLVALFLAAMGLFVYASPLLAIVFLFVAYEMLRRNHYVAPSSSIPDATQYLANRVPKAAATQAEKNADLKQMNPAQPKTLEEEIVGLRAPIAQSEPTTFVHTAYLPVADKSSIGASLF